MAWLRGVIFGTILSPGRVILGDTVNGSLEFESG